MNKTRYLLAIAATAWLLPSPAFAGEELLFGPLPDWVEPPVLAAPEGGDEDLPVRTVLYDEQMRLAPGEIDVFTDLAMKIQGPQGLGAGNLSFPWNPETDDLTIHKLLIHRGDQVIDVLESGQTFTTLRREQNLDLAMLDGELTANIQPEDLQVGDILEIAYSMKSHNPVLGDHVEATIGPANFQVDKVSFRVEWPTSLGLRLSQPDQLPKWKIAKAKGVTTARLTAEDLEPILPPRSAPTRFAVTRFVEATDFKSWEELAALFAPMYAKAAAIPAEGKLRDELEKIRTASDDPTTRAEAALRLVQDRVRYVALAMGTGGLVPADASDTWARRYGDCKAKTALLLGLLGELGIEAEPVFVTTQGGDALADRLPIVGMFDHVLVRAQVDGHEYWLDGTRSGDRKLANLTVPAFGWGLPLGKDTAGLVAMLPAPLDRPDDEIAIQMDARQGVDQPAPTTIEATLRGDDAIGLNNALVGLAGNARDQALKRYWRDRFNFIDVTSTAFAFDPDTVELKLSMEGAAKMEWDDGWYETDETSLGFDADFTRDEGPHRDAPFAIAYPFFTRTKETILLPKGFGPRDIRGKAEVDETVANIHYFRHAEMVDSVFTIERTARSVAPEFSATDALAAQKRLRELRDSPVHLKMPFRLIGKQDDLDGIVADGGEDAGQLVDQGSDLMRAGRTDDAIAKYRKATELDPANALAWANLALALGWAGDLDEGEAALKKAEALGDKNALYYRTRGLLAERRRDFQAAADNYGKSIEIDPTSDFDNIHNAMALLALDRSDEAMAAADRALEQNPHATEASSIKTMILFRQGKTDEAADQISQMIADNPGDEHTLGLAGQLYAMIGRPEDAKTALDLALQDNPTSMTLVNKSQLRPIGDFDGRLADLGKALELTPGFAPALQARAEVYRAMGKRDDALADIGAALEAAPKNPDLYIFKANLLKDMGRREEAIAVAGDLVAAMPDSTYAHVAAGKIYSAFGMRTEAIAQVRTAIAIKPEPFAYVNLSQVRDPKDYKARLADLDQALKLDPHEPQALSLRGDLLLDMGNREAALETYRTAIDANPLDPFPLIGHGTVLWKMGRKAEALDDFEVARSLTGDPMMLNNICYMLGIADVALETALEDCNASLEKLPDAPPTLDSRGLVLLRLGRIEEAIADYDKALSQVPSMAPSLFGRALALAHRGDMAKAQADLAAAIELDPGIVADFEREGLLLPAALKSAAPAS